MNVAGDREMNESLFVMLLLILCYACINILFQG